MLSQTPRLPGRCILLLLLLLLLLHQGKTDQVALYQAVDKFSTGCNATLIVRGDTVSGCKLVLLDKERGRTCCYSAPERRDTLCDPSIQSESCREKVKVVEEPGFCNITLPNIVKEDAGPYLVIFPGKVNDNQELEVQVVEKSDKGLFLPAASAISRYEEVRGDFVPGPLVQSPSWGTQTQVARSCWWRCQGTSRAASQRLQEGRPCVTRTHRVLPVGRKTGIGSFFSTHFLFTPYSYC